MRKYYYVKNFTHLNSTRVQSTAKKCAPVWCRSYHTHLFDRPTNETQRIVIGHLKPTPTEYLLALFGIAPGKLHPKLLHLNWLVNVWSQVTRTIFTAQHLWTRDVSNKKKDSSMKLKFYWLTESILLHGFMTHKKIIVPKLSHESTFPFLK